MSSIKTTFLILGLFLFSGCYGSPAFDGFLTVIKEGQSDSGSAEPCIGETGTATLGWSDTQEQVPTLLKYTLYYGAAAGVYSNIIDLPTTNGVPYTTTKIDGDGNPEDVDMQEFEYKLEGLERGYTYYFMMKANNGMESPPSPEVFKKFEICPQSSEDTKVDFSPKTNKSKRVSL